jgi:competence protein ComEC
MDNGRNKNSALLAQCQARIDDANVPSHVAVPGESLDLGDGLALEVLHPPPWVGSDVDGDLNNESVVLRLVWNRFSFLLTGDLEAEGERLLIDSQRPVRADVLKVSHHGSGGSSTDEFLAAVSPRYAVISVGADNRYEHPDPEVLDRLSHLGAVRVLRTDQDGTIEFVTDDKQLWINTSR